mmetsp:Transcript_24323/g.35110  ORF Transcript_24323/g.35110 Transcript_24323/m.35110 type:complete len:359 (-) Transcript_24323:2761-3837(-)
MAFVVELVAGCGRPSKLRSRKGRSAARRDRHYMTNQSPSTNDRLPVVEAPGKAGVGDISERVRDFMRRAPGDPLSGLMRADEMWLKMRMRTGKEPVCAVVEEIPTEDFADIDFDVLICGGSLGIFLALSLAKRGLRVAVVERGRLIGRDQEWNVSRKEMKTLIEMGLLTDEDIEEAIVSEFNPERVSFKGMDDILISDVLNCGVSPKWLLERARTRFVDELGGTLLEEHRFEKAGIGRSGVQVILRVQSGASGSLGSGGAGTEGKSSSETVALLLVCWWMPWATFHLSSNSRGLERFPKAFVLLLALARGLIGLPTMRETFCTRLRPLREICNTFGKRFLQIQRAVPLTCERRTCFHT